MVKIGDGGSILGDHVEAPPARPSVGVYLHPLPWSFRRPAQPAGGGPGRGDEQSHGSGNGHHFLLHLWLLGRLLREDAQEQEGNGLHLAAQRTDVLLWHSPQCARLSHHREGQDTRAWLLLRLQ